MSHDQWQRPLFTSPPPPGWTMPTELPDLRRAGTLAIDLETFDPGIEAGVGSASVRGAGHIVGIAVATEDGNKWYYPIGHAQGVNMDPAHVIAWAKDLGAQRTDRLWVGTQILYDLEWLRSAGVELKGRFFDVAYAAALLDEQRGHYNLNGLALDYLGEGKQQDELYQYLAVLHGGKPTREAQIKYLHTAPPSMVGPYAQSDVDLPMRLYKVLWPMLRQAELVDVCRIEMRLIPLLLDMRYHGVRVDVERAERVKQELRGKVRDILRGVRAVAGCDVDLWAADSLRHLCAKLGVTDYRVTPVTKQPSFTREYLEDHSHPVLREVAAARKYDKLVSTFIDGYVLGAQINGRIHASYHPLRSDDGGTVSGRFSSSNPNLQNIPARDKEANALLRRCFVPDHPHHVWWKYDYSQVEYRLLAHEAVGVGSAAIRQRYQDDPATDYHEATRQLIYTHTGVLLERGPTKNINFGLAYGMQPRKLAQTLGMTVEAATPLFDAYHRGVPFVQATFDKYARIARALGEVRTILGRRRRFPLFGPRSYEHSTAGAPYDEAVKLWGEDNLRRLDTHKGLNQRLQGSAADIMKKAMVDCFESGVCAEMGVPLLTVHDELGFSAPLNCAGSSTVREIMETCVPLKVPLLCAPSVGPTWGETA